MIQQFTAIIKGVTYYTGICSFQINYLIDECFNIGKGANTIISMIHHFFEHHAFGETKVHLHAVAEEAEKSWGGLKFESVMLYK